MSAAHFNIVSPTLVLQFKSLGGKKSSGRESIQNGSFMDSVYV